MKKQLTIAQAARELNALAQQRLTSNPNDAFLKTRLEQFTSAVDTAITQLQNQVAEIQALLAKK